MDSTKIISLLILASSLVYYSQAKLPDFDCSICESTASTANEFFGSLKEMVCKLVCNKNFTFNPTMSQAGSDEVGTKSELQGDPLTDCLAHCNGTMECLVCHMFFNRTATMRSTTTEQMTRSVEHKELMKMNFEENVPEEVAISRSAGKALNSESDAEKKLNKRIAEARRRAVCQGVCKGEMKNTYHDFCAECSSPNHQ